ncbi:MAG: phage holin family protein [Bifidobacteriaceae bacterium]|jgi:hypothetical protein|nr:phage holin family protein [Bifidobacteriaceae bacterium]
MAKNALGTAISEALSQISALYRTTAELAKAQFSKDGTRLGLGLALLGCALVGVLGVVPLLVLALVWGLIALGIWPWAAYLITAGAVLLAAAGLAVSGQAILKRTAASIGRTTQMIKDSLATLKGEPAPPTEDNPVSEGGPETDSRPNAGAKPAASATPPDQPGKPDGLTEA